MNPNDICLFRSFGREWAGTSILHVPTTVDQVRAVFKMAKKARQRVCIRAGGHSFHDQALHEGDTGKQIVLSTDCFNSITFAPGGDPNAVRLGAGVKWIDYFNAAVNQAITYGEPLRLPGSIQTGRKATAGGTLSGDCLSRFSAVLGKESAWIKSFTLITTEGDCLNVDGNSNPQLFNAVIGGHGYLGFVTDITYKLISIDRGSCARTKITTYQSFKDLVDAQTELIDTTLQSPPPPQVRAISSVWFTDLADIGHPDRIRGGVFDSVYGPPSNPPGTKFPPYADIDSQGRYLTELATRFELGNLAIDESLYLLAQAHKQPFENDLMDFLFFMDGNTVAKERFEKHFSPQLFPIVQQTFVLRKEDIVAFAENCERKISDYKLHPTETDMLFVAKDQCLMSGSYNLDGFAVSVAFEPIAPDGSAPPKVQELMIDLTQDCRSVGGRLHLVKNVYAEPDDFRKMFSPQIEQFENIKKNYDPSRILQNGFSDRFFAFRD